MIEGSDRACPRDVTLDVARGVIMVLMALDHTRIFLSSAQFDPTSVSETTPAYFLMRWITHLCAPGFFFLAGIGLSLAERGGLTAVRSSRWLISRGFRLIALEFTVVALAWSFAPGWFWFGVIGSLGAAMVCMAVLRWLPPAALGLLAAGYVVTHDAIQPGQYFADAWAVLLFESGTLATPLGPRIVLFPLAPWLAVMVLGYALGPWLTPQRRACARRFFLLGTGAVLAFFALRSLGIGEPPGGELRHFPNATQYWMSYFDVEKYPPSLQFLGITLGLLCLLIASLARRTLADPEPGIGPFEPLRILGREPLFFYLLHLYVIHGLALAIAILGRWPIEYLFWKGDGPNLTPPIGYGLDPPGIYAVFVAALAILYFACRRYGAWKARSARVWVRHL